MTLGVGVDASVLQGDGAACNALLLEELVHDHRGDPDLHLCTADLAVFNIGPPEFMAGKVGVVSREAPSCRLVLRVAIQQLKQGGEGPVLAHPRAHTLDLQGWHPAKSSWGFLLIIFDSRLARS